MWNSWGGGKHHSLLSPGTRDFTRLHKAPLKPEWGEAGRGVSIDWCITSYLRHVVSRKMLASGCYSVNSRLNKAYVCV